MAGDIPNSDFSSVGEEMVVAKFPASRSGDWLGNRGIGRERKLQGYAKTSKIAELDHRRHEANKLTEDARDLKSGASSPDPAYSCNDLPMKSAPHARLAS